MFQTNYNLQSADAQFTIDVVKDNIFVIDKYGQHIGDIVRSRLAMSRPHWRKSQRLFR